MAGNSFRNDSTNSAEVCAKMPTGTPAFTSWTGQRIRAGFQMTHQLDQNKIKPTKRELFPVQEITSKTNSWFVQKRPWTGMLSGEDIEVSKSTKIRQKRALAGFVNVSDKVPVNSIKLQNELTRLMDLLTRFVKFAVGPQWIKMIIWSSHHFSIYQRATSRAVSVTVETSNFCIFEMKCLGQSKCQEIFRDFRPASDQKPKQSARSTIKDSNEWVLPSTFQRIPVASQ